MVVMHTIASDDDETIEHVESSSDEIAILEAEEAAAEAAAKAAEARLRLLRARRTSSRIASIVEKLVGGSQGRSQG